MSISAIPPPEPKRIRIPIRGLYIVAFADSAGGRAIGKFGRSSSRRSRSAIVVCGQDPSERVFMLDYWVAQCPTDELIEQIFATQEKWKPAVFGIDSTGTQKLFADALRREAREKGKTLPLTDFDFEGDKDFRIETTLQPRQSNGTLFRRMDIMVDDLQQEYEGFPNSSWKDILDAWVGCIKLMPVKVKATEARDELRQYREYLRSQRLSEIEIERRIERELLVRERGLASLG